MQCLHSWNELEQIRPIQETNPTINGDLASRLCNDLELVYHTSDEQINRAILERVFNAAKQELGKIHPVVASRFYQNLFLVGRKFDIIPMKGPMQELLINDPQLHINLIYVASLCYLACFNFLIGFIDQARHLENFVSKDMQEPVITLRFGFNIKIEHLIDLLVRSVISRYDFLNAPCDLPEGRITLIDGIQRCRFDFVVMQIQIIEKIIDSHTDWSEFIDLDKTNVKFDLRSLYRGSIIQLEDTIAEIEKRDDITASAEFIGFTSDKKYNIAFLKDMLFWHKMFFDIESNES
tara:strand:+ start:4294 stop:5172 length:879 start_codon:yes stop_codon:yes gene_type:complete